MPIYNKTPAPISHPATWQNTPMQPQGPMQAMADNSDRVKQLKQLQQMADSRPVQLKVDTNGGAFDTKEYVPAVEQSMGSEDTFVGANMRLIFTPNNLITQNTDVHTIGLVQTVKTMERKGDGAPESRSPDDKTLPLKLMEHDESYGVGIDKRDEESYNGGLQPVSPVYAEQAALNKAEDGIGPRIEPKNGYQSKYFGRNWNRGSEDDFAELADRPRSKDSPVSSWQASFEVAAMVLDGQYKDSYLGSVNWGWSKQRQTNKEDAPVVTLTPPAITLASPGVPTANFQKAGIQWNKVMDDLPPTVDKVKVFDEYGADTETTKDNIPRNITYLPNQVEEIQPVNVATLTNTELLARYRMLNDTTGYKNANHNALEITLIVSHVLDRIDKQDEEMTGLVNTESNLKIAVSQLREKIAANVLAEKVQKAKKSLKDLLTEWEDYSSSPGITKVIMKSVMSDLKEANINEDGTLLLLEEVKGGVENPKVEEYLLAIRQEFKKWFS